MMRQIYDILLLIAITMITRITYVTVQDSPWCHLDSGATTITDHNNKKHIVYVSATRDGSRWLRVGSDQKAADWIYQSEFENKYQINMFPTDTLNLLKTLNYTRYCVLSDLDFSIRMESAWQPSYVVVFNPGNRRSKLLRFPNEEDCSMQSNLTLSESKQEFLCNGGPSNRCGYKAIPAFGISTGTQFLKSASFDPQGNGNWRCSASEEGKSFTFHGSYYYGYLKMAQCTVPTVSRSIGYDVIQRIHTDDVTNVIMIPDPTQRLLSDVVLQGWQVYAKVTSIQHQIYLQIWRPLETANQYSLVTHILFEPQKLRFNEVLLESDLLIHSGDVIGFYFRTHNPIPYSSVPCARNEQFVHFINRPSYQLTIGDTHTFSVVPNTRHLCRHYSINAILEHSPGTKRIETWQCPGTNAKQNPIARDLQHHPSSRHPMDGVDSGSSRHQHLLNGHRTSLLAVHVIVSLIASLALILTVVAIVSYYKAAHR